MARIRSIKPELRTSITVSLWPREVRYFFVLLWGYLDDHGRGVDDGMLIAADCFPRDRDITAELIDEWLDLLAADGPVCRYEVNGRPYLHCPNWSEHQKPQHPGKSRVPPCPLDEETAYLMWLGENPPREYTHPKRAAGGRVKVSDLSLLPPENNPSGGLKNAAQGLKNNPSGGLEDDLPLENTLEKTTPPLKKQPLDDQALENGELIYDGDITSGQPIEKNPHETRMRSAGQSQHKLTPEQGAGSREQGAGEQVKETSAIAGVDGSNPEAGVDATESRDDESDEPYRDDVEKICLTLADRIEDNGSKRPTITKRWRNSARLMVDKDERTLEQVLAAIDWCQRDEFWRGNILSVPKLRDKYDQLRLAATRQRGATPAAGRPSTATVRVQEAADLAARLAAEEAGR